MRYFLTPTDRPGDRISLVRRSAALMRSIAGAAGEGTHRLSVVLVSLHRADEAECTFTGPVLDETTPDAGVVKTAFLLAQTTNGAMAMVVLRSTDPHGAVTVMSWAVSELVAHPATAAQSRIAHCISEGRDDTDPDPGVTFADAPALI
ncbi:hypothetical protein AB0N28_29915 [Streptomyces sp. NPDC051130]|uniref:hypothetical protein n=1 Tax=Streptomyces sp. NPDC051130 TaxID=3157223 RepID=UPI003431A46F